MPTDPTPDPADVSPDLGFATSGMSPDAALADLVTAWREADAAMARLVTLAGRLDGPRAAREEGMTVDGALRLHTGGTRSEVSTVLTAAEVLAAMPVTAGLFDTGVFTWGHIRSLVTQVRRLDTTTRTNLDRYLGEHMDRLERLDSDGRLDAIDDAVVHHSDPRRVQDRAERAPEGNVLVITPRLDGTGTLYTDLDPEGFATVTGRLHHEADTPLAPSSPGDDDSGLPRYTRDRPSRGRQLADALVRICSRASGASGAHVRFAVLVDVDRMTDAAAGSIQGAVAGRAPRLSGRTMQRLVCDAAYDLIVRDGTELLAAHRDAPELTAATRRAVAARDQGCRFPSCRAPASWCDVHHVVPRAAGGDHAMANLVLLCRKHHTIVHRRGWAQTLEPDGAYHLRRRGRTWTTHARTATDLPPPGHRRADLHPDTRAGRDRVDRAPTDLRGPAAAGPGARGAPPGAPTATARESRTHSAREPTNRPGPDRALPF